MDDSDSDSAAMASAWRRRGAMMAGAVVDDGLMEGLGGVSVARSGCLDDGVEAEEEEGGWKVTKAPLLGP